MLVLSILFFLTATLYSSVGFGGGSTYLALLLIWGVPYYIFPAIALLCNIFVVSGNCYNYIRAGNLNLNQWDIIIPSELIQHDMDARPIYAKYVIPALNKSRIFSKKFILNKIFKIYRNVSIFHNRNCYDFYYWKNW